ncbi:hypothetical protein LDENG_00210660 [Lucifuga dentata]|nr:hypothetical protein LDENG_00210660 [Lucifuga dentata]
MSSVFRPSNPQLHSISNNGAHVLRFDKAESLHSTNGTLAAAGTTGTCDTCFSHLRFSSQAFDELNKELHMRTKETQKLQEEVEKATKLALERLNTTYSIHSTHGQSGHKPKCNVYGSSQEAKILPGHQRAVIQPLDCGLDVLNHEMAQRDAGKEALENSIDNNFQQVTHLEEQLNKPYEHEQEKTMEQVMMKLQTELQEVQMERDVLSDLRMLDSKKHADQMEKMLCMLEELQITKRSGDQKLQDTEDEALALSRKVETLERTIKDLYCTLLPHEKRCGHNSLTSLNIVTSPRQLCSGDLAANMLEDLDNETDKLHERLFSSVEQLGEEEYLGLTKQKERMEQLIASLGQEVATLTDKLSSWKSSNIVLCAKMELLKKHAERQTLFHQHQVSHLESALSHHKDKVCCLEQLLTQAQSEVEGAQKERDQSLYQREGLESQLRQLKLEMCQACEILAQEREQKQQLEEEAAALSVRVEELHKDLEERNLLVGVVKEDFQAQMEALRYGEQQQRELQKEVQALRGQLEVAREKLHRAGEEKTCLHALLEQRAQEGRKTQKVLEENKEELEFRRQEAQRDLARLEEVQSRCELLHAEVETLRLKLDDREKTVEILKLQTENSTQMAVQHGRTIDRLHQENSHLSNQLNQHKLEVQQLKAELDQQKSGAAAAEQQKHQLQASVAEQRRRVHEETLAKQQLTMQLEVQRVQLLALTKEHKELQRLHSCRNEEREGAVLKLQSQLRNTHTELDQARSNLMTREEADGHGFQVAVGMQKQITARREQIDSLQGRIQQLEETMEKMYQEKRYQDLENQRQLQELAFIREEKKQLATEMESLHSKEKRFRERIHELEAALHKMSESFAGCKDFIQLQKQEFYRLKLQHALDLKELQGQNLRTAVNVTPSAPVCSVFATTPSSPLASNTLIKLQETWRQQDSPTHELRSLVKELRGVISENHRPHTSSATGVSSIHRRRSAPERVQSTMLRGSKDAAEEVRVSSKLEKKTYSSEPQLLKTAGLNGKKVCNSPFGYTAARYTSAPKQVSPGRKSPVHSLLTSHPNS